MLRSLLRATAAIAFALLIAPPAPFAATGPNVAYDEIVRVVVNATPPPPGNFQADVAALGSATAVAASPTPAPRKRGLNLGNLASVIAGGGGAGDVAGAAAGNVASNAMDNAVQASLGAQFGGLMAGARSFLTPHLLRYAYWNGWERVEDVSAQTATIRKCDAGQVIHLNLAAKTYTIDAPGAEPTPGPPAAAPARRNAPSAPAQPGSGVATLTEATRVLGPLRIDNTPTTGYDTATTFAMKQSTGSCHDGGATIETTQYLSGLAQPTVNACPIRRPPVPTTASEAVSAPSGGCRPTFSAARSGPTPPANRLALYSLVRFSPANAATPPPGSAASAIAFLTERGNLRTLSAADTGLFAVPAGFTRSP
ncbi:MAG TPA: hypothetical protein VHT53_11870 [Candidatus Elarobacter sp.]|jgi:hypothetical protein|nr:hypothetical protein [Candidatus Elarobacter sp.]